MVPERVSSEARLPNAGDGPAMPIRERATYSIGARPTTLLNRSAFSFNAVHAGNGTDLGSSGLGNR